MAVTTTAILGVRITGSDGGTVFYPWDRSLWYLISDERPYLDLLVVGYNPVPTVPAKGALEKIAEDAPKEGASWIRWNLGTTISSERALGEVYLDLKVPSGTRLQAYVIPAKLIGLVDVLRMANEIEAEVGIRVVWDDNAQTSNRVWSTSAQVSSAKVRELVNAVEKEFTSAIQLRRVPFHELGPNARRGVPLSENTFVSHWANIRRQQLQSADKSLDGQLTCLAEQLTQHMPPARNETLVKDKQKLIALREVVQKLLSRIAGLIVQPELTTAVYPTPVFQRDHRLRKLLRAFGPPVEEALSPIETARSMYPPVTLNRLWELWGAVWLAKQFRRAGFTGSVERKKEDADLSLSWQFRREDVILDLDYQPATVLVNHDLLPPPHQRSEPALEWAIAQQLRQSKQMFVGSASECSPDYLIRLTTPNKRALVVGDACLADPAHHSKGRPKPLVVEGYRRTIGWAVDKGVVRCHPMGGFVVFPPLGTAWDELAAREKWACNVPDCTLLYPATESTQSDDAYRRLINLISAVVPELRPLH